MLPIAATIATGFKAASGCAYRRFTDELIVVDSGEGTISAVHAHSYRTTVLGRGYSAPADIVLSADGVHAYVTERIGNVFKVNLSSADADSTTTTLFNYLSGPEQIALDEVHGFAWVAEFTASRLVQIRLVEGSIRTRELSTWANPGGVLLTSDGRFAYVSHDSGHITRFDFRTDMSTVIAYIRPNAPRFLTWADSSETVILFPVSNSDTLFKLDLTASPRVVTAIAAGLNYNPWSVAVLSPGLLLITSANDIQYVDLTVTDPDSRTRPILLGIGSVPADDFHIREGYADTTVDPDYFFQVKDAPFGGTLPLMINWERARHDLGASFYQVFIGPSGAEPVQVTQAFSDYRWNGDPLNLFELVTTVPTQDGYYPLRARPEIWLNHWLGLLLDTSGLPNGLNTIRIKLFESQDPRSEIPTDPISVELMIDNTVPTARIEQIGHDGLPVDACSIVSSGSHTFTFAVTAEAPQHLRSWDLTAYWGDNQSAPVASDDYSHHGPFIRIWTGLHNVVVPPPGPTPWDAFVPGDLTSIHCAHTFLLTARDRVINGWCYIHGVATYHKSITLMF